MSGRRRVPLPQDVATELRLRCSLELKHRVEQRYREQVARWAAEETGSFPTREQAKADEEEALEVLLHALGELALLNPVDVFPASGWRLDVDWRD